MEASYFLRHFLAGLKYRCAKAIRTIIYDKKNIGRNNTWRKFF
jgi:hypothetical protein